MIQFVLAFLCGILLLQLFSQLPERKWAIFIVVFVIFLKFIIIHQKKYLTFVTALLLGVAWAIWYAHSQMAWTLPEKWEGKNLSVIGQVATIPEESGGRTSFLFALGSVTFENQTTSASGYLRLSWQDIALHLQVGDKWQLPVRLKRIHGTRNPGGFDYEAWSFHEGIRANGYVVLNVIDKPNLLLSTLWERGKFFIHYIRQLISEKIAVHLPNTDTSPWISALAIGERHGILAENWQVLRNTGTNHLMAIAGLHIGFMSAFAFHLVAWCWRRIPRLAIRLPAQHAGGMAALMMALIYSGLAGFSIPTQRACLMLSSFLLILLLRRKMKIWHAWSLALLVVLLLNPLSVLSESFWLSFASVALIIYGMQGRISPKGLWWKFGRIQWVIALGLIPLSIGLFQQCSFVSFIANSLAIPWVGFVVVPLTLVGCFFLFIHADIGGFLLILADKLLAFLWEILIYLANLSFASWYQVVPSYWIIAALLGMIILLIPLGMPGRWFGIIWLLPFIFYKPPVPKLGEAWFTLLDVGQGLAAVVQTKNHLLVFDTGAKLGESFDMGESVVLPFLRTLNAKKIDLLVISHGDNDHSGGATALQKALFIKETKTSEPERFPAFQANYCLRGQQWEWDNVHFSFLYPTPDYLGLGNDSSCVLKIRVGQQQVLLTGDIEKLAEKYLVQSNTDLSANIIVAPHHGSKTSGNIEFIEQVNPDVVLYPIGYRNRYHFPHSTVIEKYQRIGATSYDTAHAGAIQFRLVAEGVLSTPDQYRQSHLHYWHMR